MNTIISHEVLSTESYIFGTHTFTNCDLNQFGEDINAMLNVGLTYTLQVEDVAVDITNSNKLSIGLS